MIAKHIEEDPIISKLLEKWIPKTLSKETECETILDKFTIKRNNILLKSDRLILLATFQKKSSSWHIKTVNLVKTAWLNRCKFLKIKLRFYDDDDDNDEMILRNG